MLKSIDNIEIALLLNLPFSGKLLTDSNGEANHSGYVPSDIILKRQKTPILWQVGARRTGLGNRNKNVKNNSASRLN